MPPEGPRRVLLRLHHQNDHESGTSSRKDSNVLKRAAMSPFLVLLFAFSPPSVWRRKKADAQPVECPVGSCFESPGH